MDGVEYRGRAPVGGLREAKCEISVQFLTFPCRKLACNEYRRRAWTVYFADVQFKIILKIQLGL